MKKARLLACLVLVGCSSLSGLAADGSGFAGRWKLDPARGSSISPWTSETLTITVQGETVALARDLRWGETAVARRVADRTELKTDGRTATVNHVSYWVDSWFNNAYIGGDHAKRVTGEWLEAGRVLKVETKLALDAQQGDFPVHIYDEYHLSADGRTLRLFELRSTRDQALTYVFTRE